MTSNKENDEATKLKKRCNAVAAIEAKPEYIVTTSLPDQPRAPDPYAKMSKRQWEKAMMTFRFELRAKLHKWLGLWTTCDGQQMQIIHDPKSCEACDQL